jgi:hypothetical protein
LLPFESHKNRFYKTEKVREFTIPLLTECVTNFFSVVYPPIPEIDHMDLKKAAVDKLSHLRQKMERERERERECRSA